MRKPSERSPSLRGVVIDRLSGWANAELAGWRDIPSPDLEVLRTRLAQLEATSPSIFLFDFAAGSVSLRDKSRVSRHENDASAAELLRRAQLYLHLFRSTNLTFSLNYCFPVAIDVDDHPLEQSQAPLFAFQKRAGSQLILLPDIDILAADYLISPQLNDDLDFEEKADAAVFVGATTGANVTREVVETLSLPRLRSAVFFRDIADVTFHLPKIVQHDSEDTADLIRALGVTGVPLSWREQFGYRYLLSMDGNGATCSRVAIALKSRSVLIKYASDFRLFYFDGLEAGGNFLSVATDQDVLDAIQACRERPRRAAAIAQAGRRFAQQYLSRLPVITYVACLLDGYARTLLKQDVEAVDVRRSCPMLDSYGHVQDVGDTRPGLEGWLGGLDSHQGIEGFVLEPRPDIEPFDISYQAVLSDGSLTGRCFGYDFCGTRGLNRPLRGIGIRLGGRAAFECRLSYVAAFADGAMIASTSGDLICRSPQDAELIGLRLIVRSLSCPPEMS